MSDDRPTWTTETRKLRDLREWERNPRELSKHDAEHLARSIEKFNLADPLVINQDGQIIGGHQRKRVMLANGYAADDLVDVRVPSRLLTEREAAELNIRLNRNAGAFDWDTLANQFEVPDLLDWGFTDFDLEMHDLAEEPEPPAEDSEPELERGDVPDAIWPTDNEWGVPLLDIGLQATAADLPFQCWGAVSRKARMNGTWHFYTEDYRYEALWKDPSGLINTKCANAVEPNFSCYDQMPAAVALWNIYRKRWLARWWQSHGVRVFVDLNVAEPHYELNLLGVPAGWKAWATRGYDARIASTEKEYQMALDRAGSDSILFVVYGGGQQVKAACQSQGWLWFDEVMNYG